MKPKSIDVRQDTKSVGIWIRVSTEDQAKGESPEHHEKRAQMYAAAKGWKVHEVYHLEAVSGKSVMGHHETERMLGHLRSGHITGLIFSKLARLARNTRELLDFADIFRQHDADLISLHEAIDTTTPAGRLFYTMIAAMAQWEREEIAERVAASVPIRAKLGKPTGGAAPFGYRWDNRQLVPDPQDAPIRRLVYELFLEHKRKKAVARLLNERGYRTRTGSKFSDTTVERLIRDPTAKGLRRANYTKSLGQKKHWKLKPKDEWVFFNVEPVVPQELWERCNAILDERRERGKKPAKRPVHLFTGLVHCSCGHKMYVPSNSPKYVCYRCRNKIAIEDLEAVFQEQLKTFLLSPEEVSRYLGQADEDIKAKEERLKSLESEAGKVRQEMEKVYRAYVSDQLSVEAFGSTYRPLEERAKALQEEIPRLQGEVDFLKIQFLSKDEVLSEAQSLHERWPALSQEEKRQVVEAIVEAIRVGKEEVEIDLACFPAPSLNHNRLATQQHRCVAFLPLRLRGPRPRVLPRGYPRALRTPGDHLRKLRLDLGLRQRDLAARLGVREETLATWERGQAKPLARHYGAIVRFLGYDPRPVGDGLPGRLNAIRRRLGLTQAELAARAGFDEGSICRWESGRRRPSRWMASRLAAVLDRLESGGDANAAAGPATYFDLTRWRRRPPPNLMLGKPETLGDVFRHRRLDLGLSQAEAGKRFGVGRATVYRWERGQDLPPRSRMKAICEFVGYDTG